MTTDINGLVNELRGKRSPTYPTEKEIKAGDALAAQQAEIERLKVRLTELEEDLDEAYRKSDYGGVQW